MQLVNKAFGGSVHRKAEREDGQEEIEVQTDSNLFAGLDAKQTVLLTHGDSLEHAAPGFRVIATSGNIIAGRQTLNTWLSVYVMSCHRSLSLSLSLSDRGLACNSVLHKSDSQCLLVCACVCLQALRMQTRVSTLFSSTLKCA